MTKLDRFSQLEGPRDGEPSEKAPDAQPNTSLRFEQIAGPPSAPSSTATDADPFAPPPADAEVPLLLVHEETPEMAEARERKKARAKAELVEHVEEVLGAPPPKRKRENALHQIARLGPARLMIMAGAVALLLLSPELGPWTWFVGPIVLGVIGASYLVKRS